MIYDDYGDNDAQVPRTTVYEYFEILKDTLLLYEFPAWRKIKKEKAFDLFQILFL